MIDTQTQKMFWYLDFHLFFLIFKRCSETITPLVQMQSEQQIHTCQVEGLAAPPKTNFLTSTPSCGVTQEEGWHFKYGKRHAALTEALHTLPTRLFPHHVTEERSGRVQHDVRISCDEFNSICRVGEVASSQIAAARSSTTFTSFFLFIQLTKLDEQSGWRLPNADYRRDLNRAEGLLIICEVYHHEFRQEVSLWSLLFPC